MSLRSCRGTLTGTIALLNLNPRRGIGELGYWIGFQFWICEYAAETIMSPNQPQSALVRFLAQVRGVMVRLFA
ncbi:hypothetical protein KAJ02_03070, partial [Candidatus Bipolaricaulota bacterium]|nr:hypothetical protein [Candidatus Bipolaricaulota bacterium]